MRLIRHWVSHEGSGPRADSQTRGEGAMPSNTAEDAIPQLIIDQLAEERARKTSLEQRGIGVITTAGVLVTLLFGLSALATKNQAYVLPDPARWTLIVAVALFGLASLLGLLTNLPRDYFEPRTEILEDLAKSLVGADGNILAEEDRVQIIKSARKNNGVKAAELFAAMIFEFLALAVLAIAVVMVLWPA